VLVELQLLRELTKLGLELAATDEAELEGDATFAQLGAGAQEGRVALLLAERSDLDQPQWAIGTAWLTERKALGVDAEDLAADLGARASELDESILHRRTFGQEERALLEQRGVATPVAGALGEFGEIEAVEARDQGDAETCALLVDPGALPAELRMNQLGLQSAEHAGNEGAARIEVTPEAEALAIAEPGVASFAQAGPAAFLAAMDARFVEGKELGVPALFADDVDIPALQTRGVGVEEGLGAVQEGACDLGDASWPPGRRCGFSLGH
jgi:hypothetical protein